MSKIKELEIAEKARQNASLNFIASENYAPKEVKNALNSPFIDKYAEGAPGKRFYAGCQIADEMEIYGSQLAKKLFCAEYANLQPHSGSSANWIVYSALLNPDQTILAMSMKAGGHLTHGHKASFTSKVFNFVHYGLKPDTFEIDYDQIAKLVKKHNPAMLVAGASSYPRLIDWERLYKICYVNKVIFLADIAHTAGFIASGVHPSPVPYADVLTMTCQKTLRGPRGGMILSKQKYQKEIERAVMPGMQGGPQMNVIAAKCIMLEHASTREFRSYTEQVLKNAKVMSDKFKDLGYEPISGGTDNHIILLNTHKNFGLSGKDAEQKLEKCNIIVNRNLMPDDTLSPMETSGIRIGTAAMTTRGLDEIKAVECAELIIDVLKNKSVVNSDIDEFAYRSKNLALKLTLHI